MAVTVIVTATVPGSWQLENADEFWQKLGGWNLIARVWCCVVLDLQNSTQIVVKVPVTVVVATLLRALLVLSHLL